MNFGPSCANYIICPLSRLFSVPLRASDPPPFSTVILPHPSVILPRPKFLFVILRSGRAEGEVGEAEGSRSTKSVLPVILPRPKFLLILRSARAEGEVGEAEVRSPTLTKGILRSLRFLRMTRGLPACLPPHPLCPPPTEGVSWAAFPNGGGKTRTPSCGGGVGGWASPPFFVMSGRTRTHFLMRAIPATKKKDGFAVPSWWR